MTLPPNCLSAEPSASPGDLLAGFGVPTPATGAAQAGTPFASVLTQADATVADVIVPAGVSAPAVTSPVSTPTLYQGVYYMPFAGTSPALPSVPQADASAPDWAQITNPADQSASDGIKVESAGESPVLPLAPLPAANLPNSSQGPCGMPSVGSIPQTATATVPSAVTVLVQPQDAIDVSLSDSGAVPTEATGKKPETPLGTPSKEKQKSSTKAEESSGVDSGQGATLLAYQFVAGQWVPQPFVPPAMTEQALSTTAPTSLDAQSGQEQKAGQNLAGTVTVQKSVGEGSAPVGKKATVSLTESVAAGDNVAAVPSPEKKTTLSGQSEKEARDQVPQPAQDKVAAVSTTDVPANDNGTSLSGWRFTQGRPAQFSAQEKIAASITPDSAKSVSGVNPSNGMEEKKSLIDGDKELTLTSRKVGTSTANRENVMPYSAVNKSPTVDFASTSGGGIQPTVTAATKVEALPAANASRLVQEIRQIADRISVIDRNSVEVRFDFSDTDRLSVRVEYRDGTVHTTFRTDSAQLRDVISHEWQAQGAVAEQRPYKVAEPVFSQSTSDRQNLSSQGDGSERQRAFEQSAQSSMSSFSSAGRSAGSTTSAAAPAARSSRPETSLHLHALA